MSKFLVTLNANTGAGAVTQCCVSTAKLNGKPIATVGAIASHPQAPDVLIEGIPTILLNGLPIAFSTGKTAMGGCLLPSSSVKISSPVFESYVGFAPAPRIENREEKEEAPEESKQVKLQSNYAQQQLISISQSDGQSFFTVRMIQIFGKDVTPKALEKLYKECRNGSIENPEIVVCKNTIHGLKAAYSSKTNKIYVCEHMIKQAVADNKIRHMLMAALVEEYGHHIDYLLRYVFDKNANKDAKSDEGARFAYQGLYNISYIDYLAAQSVPFATAKTPEGTFALAWEYTELRQILDKYTANRQEGTNDHVDDYEGFKVEDSGGKTGKEGFGHKNIQREAVGQSGQKIFDKNIDFLYRGNWLRDYSQLIAPMLVSSLGKLDVSSMNDLFNKLKSGTIKSFEDNTGKFNNVFHPKDTIPLLQDLVRLLAIDHFHDKKTALSINGLNKENFAIWRKIIDGGTNKQIGLIPGFAELLGVSAPHDHFDNPYGLAVFNDLKKLDARFNGKITETECNTNKTYGMKNYIRSQSGAGYGSTMVFEHLSSIFKYIASNPLATSHYNEAKNMVKLGGALHTVQDFYAHSNYAETYLVKCWFDKVRTWTEADRCMDYTTKAVRGSEDSGLVFDGNAKWAMFNHFGKASNVKDDGKQVKWYNPENFTVNKKAFYTPVTTGTYDLEDLMATGLVVIKDKFFPLEFVEETLSKSINPGERTSSDLKVLTFLRFYDTRSVATGGQAVWEDKYYQFLTLRDSFLLVYKTEYPIPIVGKTVSLEDICNTVAKASEWLSNINPFKELIKLLNQTYRTIVNYFIYQLIKMMVTAITEYQTVLKGNINGSIEALKIKLTAKNAATTKNVLWGAYPKNNNPSHTMLAKDEKTQPIHQLSGKMAIESTVLLLRQISLHQSKNPKANIRKLLEETIAHPLVTSRFDPMSKNWAKENPLNVLKLCVTSYNFELLRSSIALLDKAGKLFSNETTNIQIAMNRVNASVGNGIAQTTINMIGKNINEIKTNFKKLIPVYKQSYYRELDGDTFVEWYQLYVENKVFPEIKDMNKLKAEWMAEVDKQLDKTCTTMTEFKYPDIWSLNSVKLLQKHQKK